MLVVLGVAAGLVSVGALVNRRWLLSSVAALVFAVVAALADRALALGMGLRRVVVR
jgi:hypothetical protein